MFIKINYKIIPLPYDNHRKITSYICKYPGFCSFLEHDQSCLKSSEIGYVTLRHTGSVLGLKNKFEQTRGVDKERLFLSLPSDKYVKMYNEIPSYGGYYFYEKHHGTCLKDHEFFTEEHDKKLILIFICRKPSHQRDYTRFHSFCRAPNYHTLKCLSCDLYNAFSYHDFNF